ncbi:MAG: CapA family protein [Bacilli bacterium]|nr:CapA family protein [Bacilli bacterium]
MKKKRIKRKVKIFVLILIISLIIGVFLFNKKDTPKKVIKKDNIVDTIYNKINDESVNKDFIKWINTNYKDSLVKLDKLLDSDEYNLSMWHKVTDNSYIVLNDLYNKKYDSMDNIKIIDSKNNSLSFVGDVSLADNWFIAPKYDSEGGIEGVLSKDILKEMRDTDLMVVNSEFTVSNRGSALKGKLYTFRAKPERLKIYDEMGVDLVTLANNHVYDYGEDAFQDMLKAFDKYKIPRVGAGKNIDEAKKPYYFIINGYKIAIVNATRAEKYIMTPGATKTQGGVFRCYDPEPMINLIKELKKETDYVIPVIHFGREDSHELEDAQVSSAKAYIDAGASMVVGHHAHTLQGVEIYKDKPIIYNLGNFLFNDLKVDTAIYKVILNDDGTMEYYMIPALQENSSTKLLSGSEKQRVINDINSWSINAYLDKNGKIEKK